MSGMKRRRVRDRRRAAARECCLGHRLAGEPIQRAFERRRRPACAGREGVARHQRRTRDLLQHGPQVVAHLRDLLIAVLWVLLQSLIDDLLQLRREAVSAAFPRSASACRKAPGAGRRSPSCPETPRCR